MARPKGKTPERVHVTARILKVLAEELDSLTADTNPNKSQAIENAVREYMPKLRKLKQRIADDLKSI